MRQLQVAVDASVLPGTSGGVETVLVGLAQGFAELQEADGLDGLEVTFLTYAGADDWLHPYLGGRLRSIQRPAMKPGGRGRRWGRLLRGRPPDMLAGVVPNRDRLLQALDPDVVHYPFQSAGWTTKPFIYHPHDLQHRHLPEHFTAGQRLLREVVYGSLCRRAAVVAVATSWVRDDVVDHFGLDPAKVEVVPLAPAVPDDALSDPAALPLPLPPRYAVYPAVTWPHKNHDRLIQALARLRAGGVDVPLVLTGARPAGVDLVGLARSRGVADLVHDLGYLPRSVVQQVIAQAALMVVPTLFEAASFPVWEAFRLGVPVACSRVTSLPQQVGSAGLLFDGMDPRSIAEAVFALWTDQRRAIELAELGRARLDGLRWSRTAGHFAALYRRLGSGPLTDADRNLLEQEAVW